MTETITTVITQNVLEIVLTVISLVVSYYIIPCIKNDLVPWLKEKHLYNTVKTLVQAVEKMAESGIIEKKNKKEEVIRLLEERGITIDNQLNALIESCVKELDLITETAKNEILKENEN